MMTLNTKQTQTDTSRWRAVVRRDPRADGRFYYSVSTTGVYCRPSCPSRLPRREHVQFHDTCRDAERAGCRPCKRCQPGQPALAEWHAAKVAEACRALEQSDPAPSLDGLARAAGMSRFHFHRVFTKTTGLTPKAYASARRDERVRRELPKRATVTEAIYRAGFNSNGRFYARSAGMLGMEPKRFRRGGAGEDIRFAVDRCSLGFILAAASAKGVCAIFLGDDPARLSQELRERFPRARLVEGGKTFERWVARAIRLVEEPKLGLGLPVDLRGTAFQRRVWKALAGIPAGATASYATVAKRIGLPKAVRAVAGACAANPIAVAIPCHRVVRSDGGLSGYRWGVDRKRALLAREMKSEPSRRAP